ncbi:MULTISPECIES: GNAT family N-acetyltransferase [Streptomyces]|uniref:GNAT family N-acetyltransferase n=1 Tax=unclassified Streptomyces TaxID=2593676 RepID=UPI001030E7CC|nr:MULTISPECIES: GNAT family N-acetyltransferase [Streptomyces]
MSTPAFRRCAGFLAAFAHRRAATTVPLPGGFAALDDAFPYSHDDNQILITGPTDARALPDLADTHLGHLWHRLITVLDPHAADACAPVLTAAGYEHAVILVMTHAGTPPAAAPHVHDVAHARLRPALTRSWRTLLPDAPADAVRQLVERRTARLRGADTVHFLAASTPDGQVAAWADLYLDRATGTAQIEDVRTADVHQRAGHGDAVLATALRRAAESGGTTRFLLAEADDWPRHWYARRGFGVTGEVHAFLRA